MKKNILSALILLIFISLASAESDFDSISFATYYPAPYGVYNEMSVASRLAVGDLNGDNAYTSADMAVDNFGQPIPGSLTVANNVGIGTTRPQTPAPNDLAGNLDVNDLYLRSTSQWISRGGSVPVGVISAFGGTTPPTGYLMCDGANNISRTTYAALFAVIGTTYGVGVDGSTFKLPDLRQRFPLGKAESGTGATLGVTNGAIDHTHIGGDMILLSPSGIATSWEHYVADASNWGDGWTAGSGWRVGKDAIASGGQTNSANPPYQVVNYIIKY